jgi:hypothetical protein
VAAFLSFPHLLDTALPSSQPLPENFEKILPVTGLVRVRRGKLSVSILRGRDHFFTFRYGSAVVNTVRFASAFFGKGQFVGDTLEKKGSTFVLTQRLTAGYYQPFDPPRRVTTETYDDTRAQRRQTEVCQLASSVELTETPTGFRLRLRATGTDEVPLTVEINLRAGGSLTGAEKHPEFADAWVLREGFATYSLGGDRIRIGPGTAPHTYLQVRGALPLLPGPSLFLTALTPVDQVIEFEALR